MLRNWTYTITYLIGVKKAVTNVTVPLLFSGLSGIMDVCIVICGRGIFGNGANPARGAAGNRGVR
ncbi:MAG TPA: hypothetical protein DCZ61_07410 [Lachnospiraceae bacterium]|nr:hypothetical protein [Lachnospiraceae bacterium]